MDKFRYQKTMLISTLHLPSEHPYVGEDSFIASHKRGKIISVVNVDRFTPEWLQPIMQAAIESGCSLIHFHLYGNVYDGFEVFHP